ncbi:uncharacterized protein LOC112048827 isoform X2 [Bicyclus anynana]|uniref:Uncharacterized protein LOC112048827 isoform X2 n=1 Tax=Bicyclus anynana TaxID=110368 RepID=A0ABM3LK16_BICAN|nr:uncharacterized protein LOC112048827 isoform X2 [Bicyclus anynana]
MMPDGVKIPQSASPLARAGAGDSTARGTLHATPRRVHPVHPKKQLFSAPVSKFTTKPSAPSSNLVRIRSCLDQYRAAPARPAKIGPKAASMEDLTPTKRMKKDRIEPDLPMVHSSGLRSVAEEEAAARVGRFMLVAAWRRRRDELRCLRKTLECQVSCSERLRMQVSALKSLLESDSAKVRLAIREVERLKSLLKDKDLEKAVLEKEKSALEQDVCAAEDRASEMSIGWRNCRNELETLRAVGERCERALALERTAHQEARAHTERVYCQRPRALRSRVLRAERARIAGRARGGRAARLAGRAARGAASRAARAGRHARPARLLAAPAHQNGVCGSLVAPSPHVHSRGSVVVVHPRATRLLGLSLLEIVILSASALFCNDVYVTRCALRTRL